MATSTNQQKQLLDTQARYTVQNGSILTGVTSGSSKFPLNSSNISIDSPNDPFGPTQTPLLSFSNLTQGSFSLYLNGDWSNKLRAGDPIEMQRGSVRTGLFIQKFIYLPGSTQSVLFVNAGRGVTASIDPYIGVTGYPSPAPDAKIVLSRDFESPNKVKSLVNDFTVKMLADDNPDTFSLNVSWDVDYSVEVVKMRWRSIPRNTNISILSFSTAQQGIYSTLPNATVNSTTGKQAKIQLTGTIIGVTVSSGGSSYTTASAYEVGDGSGASFSVSLSGGAVTGITVISGGTGYSYNPSIVITGDGSGAEASVNEIENSGVIIVQQGGNYLSAPSVTVDSTYQVGATSAQITSSLSLYNEGRIDYISVLNGGSGYTGASVSISGSMYADNATGTAEIVNGTITNILLTYEGYGYTASTVTITPSGTGGTGASARANIDLYSQWNYTDASISDQFSTTLTGFKYNVPYEIEILASKDSYFRGIMSYSNNTQFEYVK